MVCRFIAKHPTISLLKSCTTRRELKQIHAQLLVKGILNNPHFHGQFVATVALQNPANLDYANHVLLHQCDNPNLFTLNSFIRAYSKSSTPNKSFHFYTKILHSSNNLSPDNYTFNFLVRTCAQLHVHETGFSVHGALIKYGFEHDPHVQTGLIFMYAELGCLSSCHVVFEGIDEPDLVCQTAMLHACAKCGDIDFARKMFDVMPQRDPIAWNAMISGYAQCGRSREALNLFHLMQIEGVKLNEVSMVLVLSACTHLGALDQGRWTHGYVERNKLRMTVTLGTALIDMYAKCGNIDKAMEVFWGLKEKNVYTWSSAIGGLAMNGLGEESLDLFSSMKQDGFQPNEVTFISVLRGCSVVGLVEEGRKHFDSMRNLYGIDPQLEHYGLMVDLYGRAGRLEEALNFISSMPMKPHAGAWSALLHACRMYKNKEMGELAQRKIVELDAKNDGAYVLLSNIYADYKNWEKVSSLRQTMKAKGVKKLPGCSVIEVDGEVHEFIIGDKSHPRFDEIELKLEEISRRLRLAGYVANTNPVLFDIEEEEKEDTLGKHSEKVAIAFGLISLKGVPIRVVMNLRICWDCHDVAKMISKIFNREIIVRDRNRFHHFKDGECSCKGYW
ncbi:putative pentatricopeptide repeat-containing protein At5g40405 isoform X2 [Gastrolobium bilobum]|uniref:putative pentatricopeptide repeat-containing protein At5g40405 isoform X2 n=1 Tax=Gastrolobium bilobum TaxID=150636 RepID=UPI002AB05C2B|nr:putative pentatricopeptide repeat-containing protein At5g40405 isoform X2 [Gastrolobium bilobum]